MALTKISDIYELLKSRTQKKRLVVAFANDSHSIEAVYMAVKMGLIEAVLVGDETEITKVCREHSYDMSCFKIVHETSDVAGAQRAVEMVRENRADIIMKGLISTDKYMRAILNKERGLLMNNAVLSHVTVMECANYHKLLSISDVAIIPVPDVNQKVAMIRYVTQTAKVLGVEKPKVAIISATEQVLIKVPSTLDAALLAKMAERGQVADAFVDGPMGLDVAIDRESAEIKNVVSEVAGDADCLIFPSLDAANIFYKTNTKLCKSTKLGAVLMGAKVPGVLSSRGDSVETKLNSIALAALMA